MKIIFAGTPSFSTPALEALTAAGHEIALVLSQPDRPAGRGMKVSTGPVALLAKQRKLALWQPDSLKQQKLHTQLSAIGADVMVVAAYGLILPPAVLAIPRLGCLNIHASLLPRWRGAAPIQRAILAGDDRTGITIMQMNQGLDTGPILLQQGVSIEQHDTAQTLHDRLALLGGDCIVQALARLQQYGIPALAQKEAAATYAPKLEKKEAEIDWRLSAETVSRVVRAFNPRPGAYTRIHETTLKIWQARIEENLTDKPGKILATGSGGIVVACGEGALLLDIVQRYDGKKLSAADFLLGHSLRPGEHFKCRND